MGGAGRVALATVVAILTFVAVGCGPDDPEPATASGPPSIDGPVVDLAVFVSPSGNITCSLEYGAVCTADETDYPAPPRADDCEYDWGPFFHLGTDSGVYGLCLSDVVIDGSARETVLPYGTTSVVDGQACQSTQAGVICWDTVTGHGFRVARGDYDLF